MSGTFLGLAGQAVTTPNVLQSLVSPTFGAALLSRGLGALGFADLPNLVLVVGGVPFFDFEVPETIHAGGEQQMTVHKYPGGVRTIDTLGPDDTALTWSGWFTTLLAEARARQMDTIRRQGKMVICSWSTYYYRVVVKKFDFKYNRFFHIGYDLTLEIVQDMTAAQQAQAAKADETINNSMTKVNNNVSGTVGAVTGLPPDTLTQGGPALDGAAGEVQSSFAAQQGTDSMLSSLSSDPLTVQSQMPGISETVVPSAEILPTPPIPPSGALTSAPISSPLPVPPIPPTISELGGTAGVSVPEVTAPDWEPVYDANGTWIGLQDPTFHG